MLRKQVGSGKKRVMHRERIWTLHIVTAELFINQQSDINQCCEVQSPSYVCKAGAEKPLRAPWPHFTRNQTHILLRMPQPCRALMHGHHPEKTSLVSCVASVINTGIFSLLASIQGQQLLALSELFVVIQRIFLNEHSKVIQLGQEKIKHLSLSTVLTILSQLTGQWPYHTFSTFTERLAHAVLWVNKALVRDALLHWSTCLT